MTAKTLTMIDSALSYIALGFYVFPCCWPTATGTCACGRNHKGRDIGKVPLTPNGFRDGTRTQQNVKVFWGKWPDANIGWWTKGHIVLDEDNKKDNSGAESIAKLQHDYGPLPATLINLSGSHLGHHYIFKNSTDKEIGNVDMTKRYPGIDIRADKGYILLPPSLHITGWRYEVQDDLPIVDAPTWLVTLLLSPDKKEPTSTHKTTTNDAEIPHGHQDDWLYRRACGYRTKGDGEDTILAKLKIDVLRCDQDMSDPFTDKDLIDMAHRACNFEPSTDNHNDKGKKQVSDWHLHAIAHADLLKTEDKKQEYLIDGFMPKSCYALLGAKPKLGKSILASQLAQCGASGSDFLGMHVNKTNVVYMQLENGDKRERSRLAMQHSETPLPITYFFEWEFLNTEAGQKAIIEMLKEYRPGLLIIDTLSRAVNAKLDQNDAGQAAEIGYFIHKLSVDFDMAIWVVHHHGKMSSGDPGTDLRGSSAFAQSADLLIGMYKNQDGTCNLRTSARDTDEVDLRVKLDKEVTWTWVNLGEDKDIRLVEAKKKIHEALDAIGEANAHDIAEEVGVSRVAIQNHLKPMREGGELEYRVNPHKRGEILYKNSLTYLTTITK